MAQELAVKQAALTLEIGSEGVAWLVFENGGGRPNILSAEVMLRLDELLGDLEAAATAGQVRALVVRSGQDGSFLAGADVREIGAIESEAAGEAAARLGQQIFLRLDRLPVPVVAAVDGVCLGGGTELILSCDYRLASDRPETRIGLPEVRLGIIPGFGGTTRLPRLIGTSAALDLILTGRTLDARRAMKAGLIHERVHPAQLYERAAAAALELAQGKRPAQQPRRLVQRLLDDTVPGRRLVLSRARKQVLKETHGHYPAPLAALDVVAASQGQPLEAALAIEARALGRLVVTPEARNLVHVFHLLEGAKKASPPGIDPRPVSRAAVLGAGVMGGGIAHLLAGHGITVRLKDIRAEAVGSGLRHARGLYQHAVARRRLERRELVRNMNRIAPTLDYSGFGGTELVIEAVLERLEVKQQVLREVEALVGDSCTITSNTSSLSISAMQAVLDRPANFCGMHFFNPVHRMPLVEVIRGEQTSAETVATVFALARSLGKTPVIVRDGPGFLVNRVLAPYLNEAGWLLADGASIEQIDGALLAFGMPMGPLRLLDEIGLDVARHAGRALADALGERLAPPPPLVALERSNLLGRKSGRGFYSYDGEKQGEVNSAIYAELGGSVPANRRAPVAAAVQERAVLAMVNEAARAVSDGIASRVEDVDVAMITGTGFPPFRGGLLRYADSLGADEVVKRLERLAGQHGPRFEPAPMLRELAAVGHGFYHA
jgi:3-hydroxyacyl-CoA dehydrogenase/enoyl-CoA hydratase/3-hydroxybutyryl-CoA epimerase